MKTQCDEVLEEWCTKLEQAIANFRVHFNMDGHLSDNTMMTIQEKNNFCHPAFANLQREFQIPTVEEGRSVSVHFYYGQLVGLINNVLTSRRTFSVTLRDADKIDAFIKRRRALDPQCPYVEKFHVAQNNIRDIEKDARNMHDFFLKRVRAMEVLNAPQDAWISEASYRELQSLATIPSAKDRRIALGKIIG